MEGSRALRWVAIGDWGSHNDSLMLLAKSMAQYGQDHPLDFVMAVGDNFYPRGVKHIEYVEPYEREAETPPQLKYSNFYSFEFAYWRKEFLQYESLQIPWKVVLGNHDYVAVDSHLAELWYTRSKHNLKNCWQMSGDDLKPSTCYRFVRQRAHFFGFDACGCQYNTRRKHPDIENQLHRNIKWLRKEVKNHSEDALWKIYFGHHPLYTDGQGHKSESNCLREKKYEVRGVSLPGFNMEHELSEMGFDLVIAGHEHVWSAHKAKGIQHICCGASLESYHYQGPFKGGKVCNWEKVGPSGFVAFEIDDDVTAGKSRLTIQFMESKSLQCVKEIVLEKDLPK